MIYCHVKPKKLLSLNYRRRRRTAPMRIEDLLNDPIFRAMIQLRQRMKRAYHDDISEEDRKEMEEDMKEGRNQFNTRHLKH